MAKFIVRVGLHDVTENENAYQLLHQEMEQVGFKQVVYGLLGSYQLPDPVFMADDATSTQAVQDATIAACKRVGKPYNVLFIEYTKLTWINLDKVQDGEKVTK